MDDRVQTAFTSLANHSSRPRRSRHAGIIRPRVTRICRRIGHFAVAFLLVAEALAGQPEKPFSVLHCSDVHVDAHLARDPKPDAVRGAETLKWLVEEAGKPQVFNEKFTAPPPAFAFITGDITEFGVIDDTWSLVEDAFRGLPCPWYAVTGNHDNTWNAIYAVMRKRHGGENHSTTYAGVHFVFLSSASPQEPVPSFDAKTRAWLKADLDKLPADTPVFLAFHHPLFVDEFAQPAEQDTLLDLLRGYNVQALLYGHGHALDVHNIDGLTGLEGGSTFGKFAGYAVLSLDDGTLRYGYHFFEGDPRKPEDKREPRSWKVAHRQPIVEKTPPRWFDIESPKADEVVSGDNLPIKLTLANPAHEGAWDLLLTVDGQDAGKHRVEAGSVPELKTPLCDLTPGAHLLSVRLRRDDKAAWSDRDIRTRVFFVDSPKIKVLWRKRLPAAVKGGLAVQGDSLIVPCNDGSLVAFDRRNGDAQWRFEAGAEILAKPAWTGEVFVFGSGDGKVYAVDAAGKARWTYDAGMPVYGEPLFHDGVVYLGDSSGRMHALAVADGAKRWVFERADFTIESAPVAWNDLLVFGAWDGYLYALNRADGTLKWKSQGPKASDGKASRYYAPADCSPVVLGDKLWVCDRGYHLGSFDVDGKMLSDEDAKVSAIAADSATEHLYCRHTDDRISKRGKDGKVIWETQVAAGRFPIPPLVRENRVVVCANKGRISVLDAEGGQVRGQYQATPGFYVMSQVAADDRGTLYAAGMDGSLAAVAMTEP